MKKISLLLVFVMLLATLFAISVFAEDKNVASEAELTISGGANSWQHNSPQYVVDGDRTTANSSPSKDPYYGITFTFDRVICCSEIICVVNGAGSAPGIWVYEIAQTNNSYDFWFNLFDEAGNKVYDSGSVNTADKIDIFFDIENKNIKSMYIQIPGYNTTTYLWEVEIYEHVCSFDTLQSITTEATCTEAGESVYACECGKTQEGEIPATGHTPAGEGVVIAPTCLEAGYTTYTCATCGESYTADETAVLGHTWGETLTPVYGSEPTCVAPGKGVYYCDACYAESEQYDMPIDPKGHNFDSIMFNSAYTFATCTDCKGYYFVGENKGIDTEYIIYIQEGRVNVYTEDWSFDEYYGYTEVSVVDGVYTFTLTEDAYADVPAETFLDASLVISINENESLYLTLTSGETVYHFGTDPNAKEDLSSQLNGTYQYVEGDVVIFEFVLKNGTVTWTISGGEANGATANYTYDGETFECDFNLSLNDEGALVYSAIHPINGEVQYVLTEYVEEEPEPEPEPEVNYGEKIDSMEVETTDTYGYFDMYTYTAGNAGQYTFFVPAGLGFYSKAQYDAYAPEEAGFYDNNAGAYVTVVLEAGEEYSFYVGATTKGTWTIDVYYFVENTELEVGDNVISEFVDAFNGDKYTFTSVNGGKYTITLSDNLFLMSESGGYTPIFNPGTTGTIELAAGEVWTVYICTVSGAPETVTITIAEATHECEFTTLNSIVYANGFLAEGVATYACSCGETNEVAVEAIFTFSGYSIKDDGSAMCAGYTVNRELLAVYEEVNNTTVKFGVVNAGYNNLVNADGKPVNADGTAAEVSMGKVAIKAVEETAFTLFAIKMSSANWEPIADVKVIICAYIIEGENVSYICNDTTTTDSAAAVTYNTILAGGNA